MRDLGSLRAGLKGGEYGPGDFEFARHGTGTGFESFMVLGQGLYLICNNTSESMDSIAKNPRWLGAQVPFAEFADHIRANPLVVSLGYQVFYQELTYHRRVHSGCLTQQALPQKPSVRDHQQRADHPRQPAKQSDEERSAPAPPPPGSACPFAKNGGMFIR